MIFVTEPNSDVARAIQLALAPVFLLTGISGLLNVMTGRLSRIIDRGRRLAEEDHGAAVEVDELPNLERRRHVVSVAITACTVAALLLCLVIVTLFVEALLAAPLEWLVGTLFTASVLALVVGLAFFLREVHMATRAVRILSKSGSAKREPQE
jgi:hypothetical protein